MKVKKTKKPLGAHSILLSDVRDLQISHHYPKLIQKLQIDLSEHGDAMLRQLISEASEDRRLSGVIYAKAKRLRSEAQLNWDEQMGGWTLIARAAIATLKKEKNWEGQVTVADVERWILANISEAKIEKKKILEVEEIYGTAKSLYQAYEYRLSALQSYGKLREAQIKLTIDDMAEQHKEKRKSESKKAIQEV